MGETGLLRMGKDAGGEWVPADPSLASAVPFLRLETSLLQAPESRWLPDQTSLEEAGTGLAWILPPGSRGSWSPGLCPHTTISCHGI